MARALVVVSRFNEAVTRELLDGAREALAAGGVAADDVHVLWVPGAFELPVALHAALATGRYDLAVALGAVIRGATYHFDAIANEATRGIGAAAIEFQVPVGFGLLTCDTLEQALARAGGPAGNKGFEAARAALETLDALRRLDDAAS